MRRQFQNRTCVSEEEMESKDPPSTEGQGQPSSGLLADLEASDSSFKLLEFCEKLTKMSSVFQKLHVGTACLALLSCDRLVAQVKRKDLTDSGVVCSSVRHLLKFLVDSLTHSGCQYSVIFKALSEFCQCRSFLTSSDRSYLLDQLKKSNLNAEIATLEESLSEETPTASGKGKSKQWLSPHSKESPSVKSFFASLSTTPLRRSSFSPKGKDDKEASLSDTFSQVCVEALCELGAGGTLVEYLQAIPAFTAKDKKEYLKVPDEDGLPTLIARLQETCLAVDAVSLFLQLPALVDVTTQQGTNVLTQLLVNCVQCSTAACLSLAGLGKKVGQTPAGEEVPDPEIEEVPALASSLADLFSHLYMCAPPPSHAPFSAVKSLVSSITGYAIKAHMNLMGVLGAVHKASPLYWNINTLVVYHIFAGLQPLLGHTGSGSGQAGSEHGGHRMFGYARLSVPCGELVLAAVELFQLLCEEMLHEGEITSEGTTLYILTFDLHGNYSHWQRVEMLITHLPLLNILPAVLLASYKKAVSLTETSRSHSKKEQEPLIKTRTEKQESLAHRLSLSLSEKISEKVSMLEPPAGPEEEAYTPSSPSTVSSSGDREGVYTLHDSDLDESEPSTGDDDDSVVPSLPLDDDLPQSLLPPPEHPLFPFMAAFLRRTGSPSTPLAPPPPPPLPPRLPPRNIPRKQEESGSQQPEPVKKKPAFYLRLASRSLTCLSAGLLCNPHTRMTEFVSKKLSGEHISCFAWLLRSVTNEQLQSDVLEMLHNLVIRGLISDGHQGLLLRELELNARCWPLHVPRVCLSLLGRVLVYRGKAEHPNGDPLAVNIWKGFLRAVEDACLSSEEQTEDFDVVYLQLMLLVWHSFPSTVRADLLTQCAHSVIKVASTRESGGSVSPLMTSRLLTILDYLLFQFSEPVAELMDQVNNNLFSFNKFTVKPDAATPTSPAPSETKFYINELQLQFATVISKPSMTSKDKKLTEGGVDPKFYNVRPMGVVNNKEVAEFDEPSQSVDEEACQITLTMAPPKGSPADSKGYNLLVRSLVTLLDTGIDYEKHQLKLAERVLAACATHQTFCLSLGMLSQLPPSFPVLQSVVDWTNISLTSSYGSCLLIHLLHLRLKLKLVDSEDLTETVSLSGYSQEETEELMAKLLSVGESSELFIKQALGLLDDLVSSSAPTLLPMISIIGLDLLVCLLHRELSLNEDKQLYRDALPTVLKIVLLILKQGHLSVLAPSHQINTLQLSSGDKTAIDMLLSVSLREMENGKPRFGNPFPAGLTDRLGFFNHAILIEGRVKDDLLSCEQDKFYSSQCIQKYLNIHFRAFAGTQTFSPVRALKSTIHSCLLMVNKYPDQDSLTELTDLIVPLGSDCLMETIYQTSLSGIVSGLPDYGDKSVRYELTQCLSVIRVAEVVESEYFDVILSEVFLTAGRLLGSMALIEIFSGEGGEGITLTDLVLLSTKPTAHSSVLQCINFLNELLVQADKSPDSPITTVLVSQMSSLATSPLSDLQCWAERVFLGPKPNQSTEGGLAKAVLTAKDFFFFVDTLKNSTCSVDQSLSSQLLLSLLPLGSELIKTLAEQKQSRLASIFDHFMNSCVILASANEGGHLTLVRAIETWLPVCIDIIKGAGGKAELDSTSPVACVLNYLSHLSSAVTSSMEVTGVVEKRALAEEVECLVVDSDPDSDDEGEGSGGVGGEEDSTAEDSEDEELNSKLCTFTVTHKEFANQHWYCCHTCKLVESQGVCTICAKVCHKGHDLSYSKYGSFFCDCGAKEDGSCQALVKRSGGATDSPLSPRERTLFSDVTEKRKKKDDKSSTKKDAQKKESKTRPRKERRKKDLKRKPSFPSLPVLKLTKQIESYKSELGQYLDSSQIPALTLQLLSLVLPPVVASVDQTSSFGCSAARQAMTDLHNITKEVEYTDSLMAATLGSQEGAFENVKLNFSGDQGTTVRQLVGGHCIKREAMCALLSQSGKRQHLCVNHDKGKLTVLQLFPILKQADSNKRKLTLTRLTTTSVPFTVLSMSHSPCKEDFLAVCGLKDAQLLTLNSSGQVIKRDNMHPSVGANGYIVKTMWVPGQGSELLLVSDTFVKLYDTKVDIVSPSFYFELPVGKIRDTTVAITDQDKFVVIITSQGKIYYQPIIYDLSAQDGPIYFTMDLAVSHPNIVEADNTVNGGGASVYYSHTLRMLFFSYYNGRSFMLAPQSSFSGYSSLCELPLKATPVVSGTKGAGPALVQWTEVQHHPGLVCALTQTLSNPVVILVKPDKVQIQELKALPNKARVQGMVAMRQPAVQGDPSSQSRTTLMTLCEDGSLRIYVTNKNSNTEYWLQQNFQPSSPLAALKTREKSLVTSRRTGTPKFPIDFFESCQQLQPNEVEFGGSDILHIYNRQQVKSRLNAGGLYLANNKPSGFSIEVTNLVSSTIVMVGARVLVGCHSLEKAPSFVEVFGRTHTVGFPAGMSKWIDVPLTREESLQADKSFKINFGPSMDASGVNFVDCIKIYSRTKAAFGWPDDPPPPLPTPSKGDLKGVVQGAEPEEEGSNMSVVISSKSVSPADNLVCHSFDVLANHCLSVDKEKWPGVSEVITKATSLLTYSVPFQLQYHYKFLLACTVSSRDVYLEEKDRIQLSHVVTSLTDTQAKDSLIEPEYYQYLLLLLLKVGKARPDNLTHLAAQVGASLSPEGVGEGEKVALFIDLLVDVFWKIFRKNAASPAVKPVVNPGFTLVNMTVACLTEVMWCCVLQDHTLLPAVLKHTLKFLFFTDSQVCVPVVKVLCKMLKDKKPKKPKKEEVAPGDETAAQSKDEAEQTTSEGVTGEGVTSGAGDASEGMTGEAGDSGEGVPGEAGDSGEGVPGESGESEVDQSGDAPQQQDANWQQQQAPNLGGLGANPAELMEQLLANPEQYMMAVNDLIPDDDAMMNLAIQLSLQQSEGGGGSGADVLGGMAQPILAAMQGVGLQVPPANSPPSQSPAEERGQPPQDNQQSHDQSEAPPHPPEGGSDRSSTSSLDSPPRVPLVPDPLLLSNWEHVMHEEVSGEASAPSGVGDPGEGSGEASDEKQHDETTEPEMANDSSGEDEIEEEDPSIAENLTLMLDSTEVQEKGEDNVRLAALRRALIRQLLERLDQVETVGGLRSICYLQLLMFLTMSLDCTREDSNLLVTLITTFSSRLFSGENVLGMVQRDHTHETRLLYLRFLNILMSRKKDRGKEGKTSYASHMLFYTTANSLLKDTPLLDYSRRLLSEIIMHPQCLQVSEDSAAAGPSSRPVFTHPLEDMSPFFQKQFTKVNTDVFSSYGRLLAEILLVLPCQLKKASETSKAVTPPEFSQEWMATLCDFLLKVSQSTGVGRRHVRKLLLHICGSKENYRLTRDVHALKSHMAEVVNTCRASGFNPEKYTGLPVHMAYTSMLKVIEQLRACEEIASSRTTNWQSFCQQEKNTLPYLFHASFVLDEGIAPIILPLLHTALAGVPSAKTTPTNAAESGREGILRRSAKKEKEPAKEKETKQPEPDKEACTALVQTFMSFMDEPSLSRFISLFLLQTNSTSLRWQAHKLLHTLYQYSQTPERVSLVEALWKMWPQMPTYGRKSAQFVDLLGYLSISTPQVLEKESLCQKHVESAIELLKSQNSLVSTHPNFHIYSQLQSLVDFDGFYLENEPCLVCNDPEIPYSGTKLQAIKSEIKYSPKMILVKLVGSYNIAQMVIRISDIKRTKMVRTVNVYYSNRTVQNVIELKNKRKMWMTARSCSLTAGQNEVKIDFPLPIVASNLVIEFSDFYDNLQAGSEVLQCPRCQASVPAHPGVCGTCGENVYQCHKCRAINYDEKDPFLCNSCGFSKYAKFDVYVHHKSSSAVDPIETEEDRQKTTSSINNMLETADNMYKILVQHRNDLDQLLGSLAGGIIVSREAGLPTDTGANKGILLVAQRYSNDCKTTYTELSKIIQGVLASRRELVSYDQRIVEFGTGIIPEEGNAQEQNKRTTPESTTIPPVIHVESSEAPTNHAPHQGWCFGCSSASIEHCINLLKALAFVGPTRRLLVTQNLIRELVRVNLRSGSLQTRIHVRRLLCQLTRDDPVATAELNNYILDRILDQISPKHITSNLVAAIRPEIMLLAASLDMEDSCWEERLRTVMKLFQKSQLNPSPAVITGVTLPCLKILQNVIYPREAVNTKDKKKAFIDDCSAVQLDDSVTIKASNWLKGKASFDQWKEGVASRSSELSALSKEEVHKRRLMEKYARIWRLKSIRVSQSRSLLRNDTWLRSMLFNRSSQSARQASSHLVESLCVGESRHRQVLDLLCSFLDQVSKAGECAQEYLELLHRLTSDSTNKWKSYLAMRGVLPQIGELIAAEIEHIGLLEDSTMSFNLSQGYALKMLTVLLQSFLKVETIKRNYKGKLVSVILAGYLSLKRLVVQRTKRIDESQELLLQMLEELTSGTEQEREEFMATCVETLNRFRDSDVLTPIFVFERLCNIIHPEENDVGEFFLSLDKDPQQEEFLQGRMQGNPYPSSTPGLGPLMRDVKNKICTDCELVALLEDDTGMELLVANKIISLDLPVKDVYKKIWSSQQNRGECMHVVYRMRGLLGDATEDMVEQLDTAKDEVNEEEEYKMAAILSKCGGLDAILSRLATIKDFIQGHNLISAALKLLGYCVKLKENRQYLLQPHLNTLNTLLGTLDLSLHYEEANGNGIGAAVAEKALKVAERFLQEASSETPVLVRTTSQDTTDSGLMSPGVADDRLQVFLKHIESSFVQSSPSIREGLMHIIPFLTFGDPRHMNVLLQHFEPYLDFEKFDLHQSAENTLYLDCFCVVAGGIGKDASGEKLKDLAKETGLTPSAIAYLKNKVPSKIGSFDTPEWKTFLSQPSLPYILKMLAGLSRWHSKTQEALMEVITELHLLEQVASEQHIGTLAENLLEVMAEHTACYDEIKRVRKATREEKKRRAMAMRQKELGALGMQVNEKGQVIAKSSLVSEMEGQLIEESGLKCCICLEGYKNQPNKILGIYTYTRKVALDEFENKPRKTLGYSTVSHFNVVHYECHSAAVKLARSRDEWESATLQNANTKCNALLPIWGPEITPTNFASSVARFHNFLQECTGLFDPSFHTLAHDIRLLLVRFAYEKSFSAESGGGGPQSNMYLIPYFLHVGAHIMNTSHCYQREERNLVTFLTAAPDTWVSSAYELDGPQYQLIVSLFVHTLSEWEEHRTIFLKRLLVLAHARNASTSLIKSLSSSTPAEFSVYKPLLMLYALVDCLHKALKTNVTATGSDLPTALLEYIRANDSAVLEACEKILTKFQEEIQPCESFSEFLDVMGLLAAVDNPEGFLTQLLSSVTVSAAPAGDS